MRNRSIISFLLFSGDKFYHDACGLLDNFQGNSTPPGMLCSPNIYFFTITIVIIIVMTIIIIVIVIIINLSFFFSLIHFSLRSSVLFIFIITFSEICTFAFLLFNFFWISNYSLFLSSYFFVIFSIIFFFMNDWYPIKLR